MYKIKTQNKTPNDLSFAVKSSVICIQRNVFMGALLIRSSCTKWWIAKKENKEGFICIYIIKREIISQVFQS